MHCGRTRSGSQVRTGFTLLAADRPPCRIISVASVSVASISVLLNVARCLETFSGVLMLGNNAIGTGKCWRKLVADRVAFTRPADRDVTDISNVAHT